MSTGSYRDSPIEVNESVEELRDCFIALPGFDFETLLKSGIAEPDTPPEYQSWPKETQNLYQRIIRETLSILKTTNDPVLLILRFHLYTEQLLERIIAAKLPRAHILFDANGWNPTYHQKRVLADGLGALSGKLTAALKGLNKVRNDCAHDPEKKISSSDLEKIGRPLGTTFIGVRQRFPQNLAAQLTMLLAMIYGHLSAHTYDIEKRTADKV
jgi:hypothetical protein